ncbi:MAG: class I SAM-dependent methyltransferase [Lagierella massiliensis]|nr:class I SAM-dependent methyltransferase [Lagierella massiliensis]
MSFFWKPELINFMKDASEYGEYNKIIVDEIKDWIHPNYNICEAGCGLGYLSLELRNFVNSVTAVDINEEVLEILKKNCIKEKVSNIRIENCDTRKSLPKTSFDKSYDALVSCMYGGVENAVKIAKREGISRVISVVSTTGRHSLSRKTEEKPSKFEVGIEYLNKVGLKYECKTKSIEFGQPLRSQRDAEIFLTMYGGESTGPISKSYIDSKVRINNSKEYPLYIPIQRERGFFYIEL